jgi:ketoreductase
MRTEPRSVLVTGATSGIGLAVARQLAGEPDTKVFLCARNADNVAAAIKDLQNDGLDVWGMAADVTDAAQIAELVETANANAPVNVLVNNVGRTGGGEAWNISDELWDDVFATNVRSVFRMTRAVLAAGLKNRSWGRIINVASTAGKQGIALGSPYSASKHAVVGFSKAVGLELAKTGITVNAVCPGYVETPMAQRVRQGYAQYWQTTEAAVLQKFEAKIPLGRYTRPEEVAAMVSYLTSPLADAVTAQALNVCGGLGNF